jgi:hypothetical protein
MAVDRFNKGQRLNNSRGQLNSMVDAINSVDGLTVGPGLRLSRTPGGACVSVDIATLAPMLPSPRQRFRAMITASSAANGSGTGHATDPSTRWTYTIQRVSKNNAAGTTSDGYVSYGETLTAYNLREVTNTEAGTAGTLGNGVTWAELNANGDSAYEFFLRPIPTDSIVDVWVETNSDVTEYWFDKPNGIGGGYDVDSPDTDLQPTYTSETADADTFDRSSPDTGEKGVVLTDTERVVYSDTDHALYAFTRNKTSDNAGMLSEVSAETKQTIKTCTEVTVVTNVRFDATAMQFQVKTRTLYVLQAGTESGWTDTQALGECE